MKTNGPQREMNYRTPGASEEYSLMYTDRTASKQAIMDGQRQFNSHLSEVSIFYMKVILLLGTLFLAYTMFGPHF